MDYIYYLKVLNRWLKTTDKAYGYMTGIPRVKIDKKYENKAIEEIANKVIDNNIVEKMFNTKVKFD